MEISFIIPIYNTKTEKLKLCFDSISVLKDIDYEVILVDDGSEPYVREYCKKYIDLNNRFTYYYIENSGVSNARNFGISHSRGKYITFVDSDDKIIPEALSKEIFELDEELIVFDMIFLMKERDVSLALPNHESGKYDIKELFIAYLLDSRIGGPVAKLFKREMLVKNNIKFNTSMVVAEDANFLCEFMLKIDNVFYVNKNSYIYDYSPITGINRVIRYPNVTIENYISIYNKKRLLLERFIFNEDEKVKYLEAITSSLITNIFGCVGGLYKYNLLNNELKESIFNLISNIDPKFINSTNFKIKIYYKILINRLWILASYIENLRMIYQRYILN